jgi:hypothetical protein
MVFFLFLLFASAVYLSFKLRKLEFLQRKLGASPFERALSLFLACLAGMYIYLLTIALGPFRCFTQTDGTFTLVASPDLDCFDEEWSRHWFSVLIGLLYIVAIPALLVLLLWKNRNSIESNKFQWRFGLLTSRFKRRYYWWNVYLLVKKTTLVMLIDLTNDYTPSLRSYLVLLLLVGTLVIETLCTPQKLSVGVSRYLNLG